LKNEILLQTFEDLHSCRISCYNPEKQFFKRYTLELYNDYSYLALYKFFDLHSCLNVDI